MSPQLQDEVVALTAREYRPCPRVDTLLQIFLKAAVRFSSARKGAIKIKNTNDQTSEQLHINYAPHQDHWSETGPQSEAEKISSASLQVGGDFSAVSRQDGSRPLAAPILYHNSRIGEMTAVQGEDQQDPRFLELFAREMAYHIKRYEVRNKSRGRLGKDLLLVGAGKHMRRVDQFIERASMVELPVLITGPFGSEKAQVACAIHFNSGKSRQPYVELDCPSLEVNDVRDTLNRRLQEAKGGTLFLSRIDKLAPGLQRRLPGILEELNQGTAAYVKPKKVRLVASSEANLIELADQGLFCNHLASQFDFLRIFLAPLRERREDIDGQLAYALEKHKLSSDQFFTAEALACLRAYDWPGNVDELERVVARLAVMSPNTEISEEDLKNHAPKVLPKLEIETRPKPRLVSMTPEEASASAPEETVGIEPDLLAAALLAEEPELPPNLHHSLKRAVLFIAHHHHEDITQTQLAEEAFVSASHLSFLFKSELGVSFKTFLGMVRIEKAKRLLQQGEMRITDVAYDIGFGDLSHFAKIFKRIVGCNPTDYRRRLGPPIK